MKQFFMLLLLCPYLSMAQQSYKIQGTILGAAGTPVSGATITSQNNKAISATNGSFEITIHRLPDTIFISHINYQPAQYIVTRVQPITISLNEAINQLDETVVIGYGNTTRRYNTGSVARVNAKTISSQPVADPLSALSGRLSGITVTQTSGVPGSMVKLQVRGRNSIAQGSDPLYIIDGVPFATGNQPINRLSSVLATEQGTGLSPFSTIAPADIESIEILKDADATAIYGSRGANGVVLITTRKGKAGKTQLNVNIGRTVSRVTRTMPMLNTKQYIALRKEAFANDGIAPTNNTAPDLLLWDTTRYTDMQDYFTGNTATATNAQLSLSGGNNTTQFMFNANYRKDGTVFPGSMAVKRGGASVNLHHNSANRQLSVDITTSYSHNNNNLTFGNIASHINLPPNYPAFFNTDGSINWEENGVALNNPLSDLERKYEAVTANHNSRLHIGYKVMNNFLLGVSIGYNTMRVDETSISPIAAQNPAGNPLGSLDIGTGKFTSWIAEPQAEYNTIFLSGKLKLLAGATLQHNVSEGLSLKATGFTSDHLLQSLAAAPGIAQKSNNYSNYKYQAVFGRVNYVLQDKYILNVSGRRDGSSRFGPGKQFSNFAAVGGAWLFANESFVRSLMPYLSYGKLRASYGTTGNDQIGDYRYLDNWGAVLPYQGSTALYPQNLFNAGYRWELNKKLEMAVETGFFKDRLLLSLAWFRNRSGNQLVPYLLPTQTGFNSIIKNHDAVVENRGFEIELQAKPVVTNVVEWNINLNLTLPKNKLLAFQNLEQSSYANSYVIGQPLSAVKQYHYLGVDPATGIMTFEDVNKDGLYSIADLQVTNNTEPKYYGGVGNNLRYKNLALDVFVEFRKQQGRNYLHSLYNLNTVPGRMYNMPAIVLERWQKPGDVTEIQQLTASTTSAAFAAGNWFKSSDGIYSDASFARLKTVALNYSLPVKLTRQLHLQSANFYLQAQNVFTLTKYKGADPETQALYTLPPLKSFACGISLTF